MTAPYTDMRQPDLQTIAQMMVEQGQAKTLAEARLRLLQGQKVTLTFKCSGKADWRGLVGNGD